MKEDLFKKYRSKVVKEGLLKSLFCGLFIGFLTLTLTGLFFWFFGWKYFWIVFALAALAFGVGAILFYKLKYQPTAKKVARRVDELGLEERIITMQELQNDNSYIAKRQREDALAALKSVSSNMIKIIVSAPLIIAVACSALTSVGVTVVHALVPSGLELLESAQEDEDKIYCEIYYEVKGDEGGVIEGETYQEILKGEITSGVLAIPDDEWMFVSWSDGSEDPYREDVAESDITIYAIFQAIEAGGSIPGEGDGMPSGEGDGAPNDSPGDNDEGQAGDGPPSENPNKTGGGKYEEVNQVVDNNTFYGDLYGDAYEEAIGQVGGGDYSSNEKDMVGGYFDGIELGKNDEK